MDTLNRITIENIDHTIIAFENLEYTEVPTSWIKEMSFLKVSRDIVLIAEHSDCNYETFSYCAKSISIRFSYDIENQKCINTFGEDEDIEDRLSQNDICCIEIYLKTGELITFYPRWKGTDEYNQLQSYDKKTHTLEISKHNYNYNCEKCKYHSSKLVCHNEQSNFYSEKTNNSFNCPSFQSKSIKVK